MPAHSHHGSNVYLCNGRTRSSLLDKLSADCSGRSYDLLRFTAFHQTAALCEIALQILFPFIAFLQLYYIRFFQHCQVLFYIFLIVKALRENAAALSVLVQTVNSYHIKTFPYRKGVGKLLDFMYYDLGTLAIILPAKSLKF